MINFDVTIIGAGVVGLSSAYYLSKKGYKVLLVEKEKDFGTVTSSRNTEFIHAGIYYNKNSLKSKLCKRGNYLIYLFAHKHNIPIKKIGKIFISNNDDEEKNLNFIFDKAKENGINDLKFLSKSKLSNIEPYLQCEAGLLSPSSGIIDTHKYMSVLLNLSNDNGLIFVKNAILNKIKKNGHSWNAEVKDYSENTKIRTKLIINSAGLESVNFFKEHFKGYKTPISNPVKGCYLRYKDKSPFSHAIYPSLIPGKIDERVDATPDIWGGIRFGPSVESQVKSLKDFTMPDGLIDKFYPIIRRYFPKVEKSKLVYDQAGLRPKIILNGNKDNDFIFDWNFQNTWLNLWGMESPALTSSLAISEYILNEIELKNAIK